MTHTAQLDLPDLPTRSATFEQVIGRLAPTRRYVCGTMRVKGCTRPISVDQVAELFAQADRLFADALAAHGTDAAGLVRSTPERAVDTLNYMHQTSRRLTLCDDVKLDNVLALLCALHDDGIPGDLIETGVWRGGMTIWMRAALRALHDTGRTVWVADSFAGLPEPDPALELRDAIWAHVLGAVQSLSASLDGVRGAFAHAGLLDRQVRFLPGFFNETLPGAPIDKLAMMRLDGDWYQSTRDALDALYPRLADGGYVIVDDYGTTTGCARAVHEFREHHRVAAPLVRVDRQAVYWQRQ
jgi:hypothetical protein